MYACRSRKKWQESRRGHRVLQGARDVLFLDLGAGSTTIFTCEGVPSYSYDL